MRFAAPKMFWLLLIVVPPLIFFLWWEWRRRQELITQFISPRLLGHLKVGVSPSRQKARLVMIVVAVILVILALARPQWGATREEAHMRGLDIIVAIDTSKSMLTEDVSPNRLTRAKLAALDLMHRAKTDRLGVEAFAGDAFLICPLTLDDAAFAESVNSLDTQTISRGGTAIQEAINVARKAFKDESDNHKVLVLFTDGEDHEGDAASAAEAAAKEGMVIFTIGVGTPEGEQLRIRDDRGSLNTVMDENGKPVVSHLDEDLLQQIAKATKGFYLHLQGTKTMDTLYDMGMAPLPKNEKSVRTFQHFNERFQWFLAAAMILLIVEMFLPDRKLRRSRRSPANQPKTLAALAETAAIFLIIALPFTAHAGASGALREYNDGDFQSALRDYNDLLDKKKDDPRLHFNAGAAAYQSHQLDEAAKQFNEALTSPDLQLQQRAYYNLGNTLYRAGEKIEDSEKKQQAWENALKQYESATKLNQQDGDAKFNYDFVKKQIEELKKQQSQSQKNDKNQGKQNQNQQNKDQNNQSQNNKSGKDNQNQQNQQSQNQQGQDKNQENKNQQSQDNKAHEKSDEEKQQEKQQQANQSEKKDQQQAQNQQGQASDQPQDKSSEEAQREAAMMAAGQMTPKQAEQLLDSQKDDDHVLQLAPPNKNVSQSRSYKDW